MRELFQNLSEIWKQIGLNQRITLSVTALGIIAVMIALVVWSSRPQYELLYGGLSSQDAASIVSELDGQGIPYEVRAGGSAVYVPGEQVHRVRMELVGKGIPAGDSIGYEIFDRTSFGVSDFVQRTNYIRAVQGELSRTIAQLKGVRAARVMVVMPENRLVVVNPESAPTASVLVELDRNALELESVRSIRSLVANSVEGLKEENVAVIDNYGRVLSAELHDDKRDGTAIAGMRHRQMIEEYLTEKVESMLVRVLGPDKAVVRVSAEIDNESQTITEERFDPDGQVVRSQQSTQESNITRESRPTPIANPEGNEEQPIQTAEAQTATEQTQTTRSQQFEIPRSLINTVRNGGDVSSVSAAVFIASRVPEMPDADPPPPRDANEIERLRNMVALSLGINDPEEILRSVSIEEVDFPLHAISAAHIDLPDWQWTDLLRMVHQLAPMGLALAFFLFLLHQLRRSRVEPITIGLNGRHEATSIDEKHQTVSPEILNELIRQKPGNVGSAIRNWAVHRRGS